MKSALLLRTESWTGRFTGLAIGALGVLGHAPINLWPMALLSLGILYARLQSVRDVSRPGKRGFSVALWWAIGYFAAGTFWVGSAFIERGPAFIPIMPFMVGGLAVLLSIFWAIGGAFFVRAKLSGFWAILCFAAIFTLAELTRGHIFGGFPWNLPAYIFEAGSRPSQMARWLGAYGLSSLVLLISAALGQAMFWERKLWPASVAILPLIGFYAIGHMRLSGAELSYQPDVNMRIVSVPFKQSAMMTQNSSVAVTNDFITASIKPGIKDVTHLVWPEGAVRGFRGTAIDDPELLRAIGGLLSHDDRTPPVWLMNSLQTEMDEGRRRYYNASIAVEFDVNGRMVNKVSNRKRKLVAFGEHIPLMDWFEDVQFPLISTNLASISPGASKQVSDFPGLPRVSPQICYEMAYPGLTPHGDGQPAAFILNQSNDAWFGRSAGPAQHANIARYRAIETGLPVIRAASNGMSGQIDPYGRVHGKVVTKKMHHIDVMLLKPLNFNGNVKTINWSLLLISLMICGICSVIKVRSVGLRIN